METVSVVDLAMDALAMGYALAVMLELYGFAIFSRSLLFEIYSNLYLFRYTVVHVQLKVGTQENAPATVTRASTHLHDGYPL